MQTFNKKQKGSSFAEEPFYKLNKQLAVKLDLLFNEFQDTALAGGIFQYLDVVVAAAYIAVV